MKSILVSIMLLSGILALPGVIHPSDASAQPEGNAITNKIFDGYETWPPESITPDEVSLLRNCTCVLETSRGVIKFILYPDEAPLHSANFVKLIQDGFYDGLTFHRVVKGFVSQGGDPSGDGTGGPDYEIPAEISLPHGPGAVAMARTGDDVNPKRKSSGSQFYFCHNREGTQHLDGKYTVFGQIVEGQDVNLSLTVTYSDKFTPNDAEPDFIVKAWVEMSPGFF